MAKPDKSILNNLTVLVVDDEPDLREILREKLEWEGFKVIEAENGKQALEKFNANKIDMVLSDIRMPGGDGITLLDAIRKINFNSPPVILISGFSDINKEDALKRGAQSLYAKPYNLKQLYEHILELVLPK